MFARISGSVASDLIDESSSVCPANAWIWSEQTIAAQRRRLGCPPFQSGAKSSTGQGHEHHRAALVVCHASSKRQKAVHAPLRRPSKCRKAPGGFLRNGMFNAGSNISSNGFMQHASSLQQQQQAPVDPATLTACINTAVQYHELEALCNTFLHNPAFSCKHAALVLSRLHQVHSRSGDSQLLLVELLAAKLQSSFSAAAAAGASSNLQQLLLTSSEVAAVCWGFARVGYQPHAGLLQFLLQQFWNSHQQQQQVVAADAGNSSSSGTQQAALAQLAAGLAGLGCRDPAVWLQLRLSAVAASAELKPNCLQQLVWAFATAEAADAATTAALAEAVQRQIDAFDAEQLAQIVWCFHVLGYSESAMYECAAQQMMARVEADISGSSSGNDSTWRSTGKADVTVLPQQQHQQQQPLMQRHQKQYQSAPKLQQKSLTLPRPPQQQQYSSADHQHSSQSVVPAGHTVLSRTAADLCNAAASKAYSVLEKYDPLLCTLALYRDYYQPA